MLLLAAIVRPRYGICGRQVDNGMRSSPETHVQGRMNKAADIFSFDVVIINFPITFYPCSHSFHYRLQTKKVRVPGQLLIFPRLLRGHLRQSQNGLF